MLTATILPETATDTAITWTSSNPLVAKVDQSGNVTCLAAGSAVITAKTNDGGKTATVNVTVANAPHNKRKMEQLLHFSF